MRLFLRVLIGYLIACLVAGLTTVLMAHTPTALAAMPGDAANEILALGVTTIPFYIALFASPFALVAIAFGERHHRRDWFYYAMAGIAVALIGLFAQYMSEDPRQTWSILGNYPLIAFITSGFLGGLFYWMVSGRLAGLRVGKPHVTPGRPGTADANRKPMASTGNRPTR